MKKNYFSTLFAALMLFVAMPASAQVSSVADLFGEYRFTADVEILNSAYSDKFSGDCDVTISKASSIYYLGEIKGIAGLGGYQTINSFDATAKTIEILNPNTNFGAEGLYMSDIDGKMNIFTGDSTQYSEINYSYNPTTKEITLPDFSLVTKNSEQKVEAIIAKFTNAKLTLVESENIEVTDLSGDWHFTAVTGGSNTMENSTLPTEWDMTLTATDESKKAYDISLTLGEFAPLALTATFDGMQLTIPFNETYFDAENKIGLVNMYGTARPGTITFNMANENLLTITSGMTIAQDSISPEVKGGYLQWYMAGSAKREKTVEVTDTWDGVYNVKGSLAHVAIEDYEYPTEFEIEVQYFEDWGIYLITKIFGNDVTGLNNGGIRLTPSTDDPNKAEITTGGYLKTIVGGESYLCLKDMNLSNSPLTLTRLEDGTYTISDFSVSYMTYGENYAQNHEFAAFYQSVTAEKVAVEEPEPTPFVWESTFTITADVQSYNDAYTYPTTFEMTVKNWGNDIYTIVNFMGYDISGLNGGAGFNVKSDSEAEIKAGSYIGVPESGKAYFTIADMNNQPNNVKVTVNEDGTLSIDNFCVNALVYDENWNSTTSLAAFYTNVKAVKNNEDSAINNIVVTNNTIEGIFDLTGRKLEAITTPGLYIVNGKKVVVK